MACRVCPERAQLANRSWRKPAATDQETSEWRAKQNRPALPGGLFKLGGRLQKMAVFS
jgi:hypothetical protein